MQLKALIAAVLAATFDSVGFQ